MEYSEKPQGKTVQKVYVNLKLYQNRTVPVSKTNSLINGVFLNI